MEPTRRPRPGDVIEIHPRSTAHAARSGVITAVLGDPGHEHFRVRWDEEHETLFWPGSDATVIRRPARGRRVSGDAVPDDQC
jgi:hypothetical protein